MLDLDNLARAILTCVTAGPGLGFNRAVLFLADEAGTRLEATRAIGPSDAEEAQVTWERLASEQKSLDELLHAPAQGDARSRFQEQIEGLAVPLPSRAEATAGVAPGDSETADPLLRAFYSRQVVKLRDPHALAALPRALRCLFDGSEVICVPLVAKGRSLGLIVADNCFTREPIDERRAELLQILALLAGLALDNARMYAQAERQAAELASALSELRAAQDQLLHQERLATVGAVVAKVSHEIRNPLTTIGGFAKALGADSSDRARVERNASIIADEVAKLEDLLREMLDFTNPRPPRLEVTDLNRLVAEFSERHRGSAHDRGVEVALELAPESPAVLADPHQIQRVLMNLFQNAIHAIAEDGGRGRVVVRTRGEGGSAVVEVQDTGIGIDPEAMPHIFTPFFTTRRSGTGLGLAVVRKLIDEHRGSIDVRSGRGAGTTVSVRLPRKEPSER